MGLNGSEAQLSRVSPPDPIQELLARAGSPFLGESGAVGVHLLGSMTAALPDRTLVRANVGERIVAACFGGRSGQEAIYLFLQGGMSVRIDRHGSRRDLHTLGQPLDAACLAFDGQREELLLASRLGVCVLAPKRSH